MVSPLTRKLNVTSETKRGESGDRREQERGGRGEGKNSEKIQEKARKYAGEKAGEGEGEGKG